MERREFAVYVTASTQWLDGAAWEQAGTQGHAWTSEEVLAYAALPAPPTG
jgi:hypothetical protein